MRLLRFIVCVMLVVMVVSSCRDKVICPAFQSTYILDDSVRQTYFSYLWKLDEKERQAYLAKQTAKDTIPDEVSTTPRAEYFAYVEPYIPPVEEVKKNKYGIIRYQPYLLKQFRMRTAPMENVLGLPKEPEVIDDEGVFIASDFQSGDSLALSRDSLAFARNDTVNFADTIIVDVPLAVRTQEDQGPKYLYKYDPENRVYNMDQVYYNKYFGESLVYKPRPKPPAQPQDSLANNKGSFFKRLFGKGKVEVDSTFNVDALINATDQQLRQPTDSTTVDDGFGTPPPPNNGGGNETPEENPSEGEEESEEENE